MTAALGGAAFFFLRFHIRELKISPKTDLGRTIIPLVNETYHGIGTRRESRNKTWRISDDFGFRRKVTPLS